MRLLVHVSSSSTEEGEDVSLHASVNDMLGHLPASHVDGGALEAIIAGTDVSWIIPIVGGWARHTAMWREVKLQAWDVFWSDR